MSKELDDLKAKTKVPVLSGVRVASPCTVDWATMAPIDSGEQVRHCGSCKKNVYNLSSMTREEAETLLRAKEGRLCVRYFQRTDGTILLKDCAIGITQKRKRRVLAAGIAAMLGGGVFAAIRLSRGAAIAPARIDIAPAAELTSSSVAIPEHLPPLPELQPDVVEVKGDVGIDPDVHATVGVMALPDDPL
jgi:hypothetical protein